MVEFGFGVHPYADKISPADAMNDRDGYSNRYGLLQTLCLIFENGCQLPCQETWL